MAKIVDSRCVLAVRDLRVSTSYYVVVLGFSKDPIDAEGWSFLTRDKFRVMLGECKDEKPASELENHAWFTYWHIEGIDEFSREIAARGAHSPHPSRRINLGASENVHCAHPTATVSHAAK